MCSIKKKERRRHRNCEVQKRPISDTMLDSNEGKAVRGARNLTQNCKAYLSTLKEEEEE